MATRNDVAKKACVSGATVSRVFNNPDSVSQSTRDKVIQAAKELNYHPNIIASNFTKGISGNIGVVVPKIPNVRIFSVYYFAELLNGIGECLSEQGYNLVLFYHEMGNFHKLTGGDYTNYFTGGKVDGCILLGTYYNDSALINLKKTHHKFCLINNYIKNTDISFIDVDNVNGSIIAVNHLINLGHKKIAFLNGPNSYINSIDRLKGYKLALESNDISFDESLIFEGNYGRKSGYYAAKRMLEINNRPSSVFVGNDRMAAGLVQGFSEEGVKVPEDISVLGYDDSDIATLITPQLTTMHVSFYELGKKCASEFVKYIKGDKNVFGIYMKPELIIRNSTAMNHISEPSL